MALDIVPFIRYFRIYSGLAPDLFSISQLDWRSRPAIVACQADGITVSPAGILEQMHEVQDQEASWKPLQTNKGRAALFHLCSSLLPTQPFQSTIQSFPSTTAMSDKELKYVDAADSGDNDRTTSVDLQPGYVSENADKLQRRLNNRQIQLIAIGGSIGTALFVSIGTGLQRGGPLSLVLAYTIYCCLLGMVNNCIAEMIVLQPVSGGFIRLAGKYVDDAFGFMAGWNFFFYEALLIPFEITALNLVLHFWTDAIPTAAVCAVCIVLYA